MLIINTPNASKYDMARLVYPELSYQIMGMLFDIHNRLGVSFEEKYYHRALEQLLSKNGLQFNKELQANISFAGSKIGKYFLDFLIEDKIVVELKTVPQLLPVHFRQVRSYLKVKNLELGILANFRGERLNYQRILNRNSN